MYAVQTRTVITLSRMRGCIDKVHPLRKPQLTRQTIPLTKFSFNQHHWVLTVTIVTVDVTVDVIGCSNSVGNSQQRSRIWSRKPKQA